MGEGKPHKVLMDSNRDSVRLWLRLAEGYKYLTDGQHTVLLASSDESVLVVPPFEIPDLSFDWQVPVEVKGEGETTLHLQAMVFFCPVSDESICLFNACDVEQPVVVLGTTDADVEIIVDVEPMA
jgi:hypothetical protein